MRGDLRDLLAEKIEPWELESLCRSYDFVGDIAVIRVPDALEHRVREMAKAVMRVNKHVKTVLRQISPVSSSLGHGGS